jgi:RimJ/RimL family protein N-acetyltransferase
MGRIESRAVTLSTGEACVVRGAEQADNEALRTHVTRILTEDPDRNVTILDELTFTEEKERKWIADHLENERWLAIVAEVDGRIAGLLNFTTRPRRRLHHAGAFGMSVVREWRGKGVGTALLTTLIDWAEAHPALEKVSLAVFADNEPAIGLYRKLGFVEEGRRVREVRFGADRYVDDLLMYRFV